MKGKTMSRRQRITSLAEADTVLESLGWLRGAGSPNREVRVLFEVAAFYRAMVHRQEQGEKKTGWAEKVTK
ncbi:hypothetical protein FRUB_09999 [Fimbriiglobus ruber]|uniref:Uncharacterized protein n=1 Tax=Fimbriiglobus ruber TaxID=1908690 RepID=A0A225DGF2_9BACT|nr:hypothetical protein FRUB_09999 [Fimbriiglobus ruber]